MIFSHDQFVIFNLFEGNTIFFIFFNNNAIAILSLKSKQSESLV